MTGGVLVPLGRELSALRFSADLQRMFESYREKFESSWMLQQPKIHEYVKGANYEDQTREERKRLDICLCE